MAALAARSYGAHVLMNSREILAKIAAYDPFARGPYPVGVRTLSARDASRDRVFPCEVWYPAAARYAGQDLAPATQDAFTVPPAGTTRTQSAARDADAHPGAYPLV